MSGWSVADIPSQAGRLAVVTGATGGLGLETALALAGAGGDVIVAGRDEAKGRAAVAAIQARHPAADVRFDMLDLASLASVAAFAARRLADGVPLDLLVNNAGVMSLPTRRVTADGFETQFGVNYLGHFALTLRLLPLLLVGRTARVVEVSSIAHRTGRIDFADLQSERRYRPWPVYCQSKLAMLLFASELQRRSDAGGWGLMSNAAHPGWSRTELFANGPRADGGADWMARLTTLAAPLFSQSAARGALPILFAATAPEAMGGGYYGPNGFLEMKGDVAPARIMPQGRDPVVAARLWAASEALTGASADAIATPSDSA
jgi:NAD(P)-dependent dehydrogenase (short-subunit alcohol dehydrogenase family)